MAYVDGFVFPVPSANQEEFRRFATHAALVFKEHGALRITECWADDVPEGKLNSMHTAVMRKPGESIVFAWIFWPDKATRDLGMVRVSADPRVDRERHPVPFDASRMIFGGFEVVVDV